MELDEEEVESTKTKFERCSIALNINMQHEQATQLSYFPECFR